MIDQCLIFSLARSCVVWTDFNQLNLDKDSDGTLDKKELTDKKIAKVFDQIDTDADGNIDAKELAAYFEQSQEIRFKLPIFMNDKQPLLAAVFLSIWYLSAWFSD